MIARVGLGRHSSATPIQHRIVALVVAVQAGWLVYLCTRGWFYQADFTLLSQATHHRLTVGYLTQGYNGHLTPGTRLTFWILAHTSRLHYAPTIVVRVVLQVIATVLLYRLLTVVSRSRTVALVVTVVYCASPLLVPGTLWLASSMSLLPAQICVLIALLSHIRRVETGRLRWSLVAGLALLVGAGFWEKTALAAVLLVILSLGWLASPVRRRGVLAVLRAAFVWVLTLGPVAGFIAYFFAKGYGPTTRQLPVRAALHLIWLQWGHSLWPAVIGAPWHWSFRTQSFISVADPRLGTVIGGQCAFGLLVVAGWRRTRWRGLLAWTLPLVIVTAGEILIGIARYASYGTLPALTFSYSFDLAIPTALAVALAFGAPGRIRAEPAAAEAQAEVASVQEHRWRRRLGVVAGVATCAVVVASAGGSALAWTSRWHDSPAKPYVESLLAGVRQLGPSANLYDTRVGTQVLPRGTVDRHLSDLLAIAGPPVTFDRGLPQPEVVTSAGQVVPARFVSLATQSVPPNPLCSSPVNGLTPTVVRVAPDVPRGAYFLRIEYFEQRPAFVRVTVHDGSGHVVLVRGTSTVDFDQQLGIVVLPLETGSPVQVTFTSGSEATSVCMSTVAIGLPTPAKQ